MLNNSSEFTLITILISAIIPVTTIIYKLFEIKLSTTKQKHLIASEEKSFEHKTNTNYLEQVLDNKRDLLMRQQLLRFLATPSSPGKQIEVWANDELKTFASPVDQSNKLMIEGALLQATGIADDLKRGKEMTRQALMLQTALRIASDKNLNNFDWQGQNLVGADFNDRDLKGANFSGANLTEASFSRSDLSGANFSNAILNDVIFTDVKFLKSDFTGARLERSNFSKLDLTGSTFTKANLKEANLDGVTINGSNFIDVIMEKTSIKKANISGSNFITANLKNADFFGSVITGSNFMNGNWENSIFNASIIDRSNFSNSNPGNISFFNAQISHSSMPTNVDGLLTLVKGVNYNMTTIWSPELTQTGTKNSSLDQHL